MTGVWAGTEDDKRLWKITPVKGLFVQIQIMKFKTSRINIF